MLHLPTAAALVLPALLAMPPVFTTKGYDDAHKQAAAEKKLLLVDSTADWCPPCKHMDKTTWVDPKAVDWLKANTVAFQFDVDKDPKLAKSLEIEAMPTLIVFKDGKEIDRDTGYKTTDELIEWLEGVKQGKTKAQAREEHVKRLREEAGTRVGEDGKVNTQQLLNLARDLARTDPDLAAEEYEWLWDNMLEHQPSMYGVRLSFMAADMQRLAAKHPAAKQRFTRMRDALENAFKAGNPPDDARVDWITLNRVVSDEDRTLAWYDRVKDDPAARADLDRNAHTLRTLFRERARWRDLGLLSEDPEKEARQALSSLDWREPGGPQEAALIARFMSDRARTEVSQLYAGLLAAQRDKDAEKVAETLLNRFDDALTRRVLVRAALTAGQAREAHLTLLDESAAKEPDTNVDDLRAQVKAGLPRR